MSQSRNFCFTLNNPTDEEFEALLAYKSNYTVIGKEKGEQNGTPHLQGYIEFASAKRITTLHKAFPRVHWEVRRGTAAQAAAYCKKDGDYYEQGTPTQQGKRTDLEDLARAALSGTDLLEIAHANPAAVMQYHKGLQFLRNLTIRPRNRDTPPTVVWRYGKTGVGKTRFVFEHHETVYIKDGTQWWDGYEQQEAICIDDFDGKWPFRDLLRLLDRYPYRGQVKGGYVDINSPYIYITCEFSPESVFHVDEELAQILRRITQVVHVRILEDNMESPRREPVGVPPIPIDNIPLTN